MRASSENALTLRIAGEPMVLLGGRAMYWPARRSLIIADLHLGKSHVFRRAGIAVPRGATRDDLQRLTRLLVSTGACALWIVGDVLHGPVAQAEWQETWMQWRREHAELDVVVLAGNHDRALRAETLNVRILGETWAQDPFLFRHEPGGEDASGRHVIAGHLHPKVRVPGLPRHWPAFWLRRQMTVLPAFSAFTGGQAIVVGREDTVVACVEGGVVALRAPS